jgi:hypothetical protein
VKLEDADDAFRTGFDALAGEWGSRRHPRGELAPALDALDAHMRRRARALPAAAARGARADLPRWTTSCMVAWPTLLSRSRLVWPTADAVVDHP